MYSWLYDLTGLHGSVYELPNLLHDFTHVASVEVSFPTVCLLCHILCFKLAYFAVQISIYMISGNYSQTKLVGLIFSCHRYSCISVYVD